MLLIVDQEGGETVPPPEQRGPPPVNTPLGQTVHVGRCLPEDHGREMFIVAARVFRPARPGRVTDRAIESAHKARTAIGIVATCWMVYAYPYQGSHANFVQDKFAETEIAAGVLMVVVPLSLAVFILAARPPARGVYLRRLKKPLTGIISLFAPALAVFLLGPASRMPLPEGFLRMALTLIAYFAILFTLLFGLMGIVMSVRHVFATADVHEVLPPLISALLVWTMFGFQLFDGSPVAAPEAMQLLFLFGPPISVTLLSLWELRRLRTHFGLTIRGALHRDRLPQPPHHQWTPHRPGPVGPGRPAPRRGD
jgi:hypothetical protein